MQGNDVDMVDAGAAGAAGDKKKEKKTRAKREPPKLKVEEQIRDGKILWVSGKFYGLLKDNEGTERWFHCSDVQNGVREGDSIKFKLAQELDGKKRFRGVNITGGSVSKEQMQLALNVENNRLTQKIID